MAYVKRIKDLREDNDKTQQEIADIIGISRVKLNHLLNELIEKEYAKMHHGMRGKYLLTSCGLYVVELFEGLITPKHIEK